MDLEKKKIDLRNIEMIVCDGDGTLWNYDNLPFYSCWDMLPKALPLDKREEWFVLRDSFLSARAKNSRWYKKWFDSQISLLKGVELEEALRFLYPIPYSKGVKEFFSSLDGRFIKGIISGGFSLVADKAMEELGMDFAVSNELRVVNGKFDGTGIIKVGYHDKGELVEKLARKYRVSLEGVWYVGDNSNDIPACDVAGLSVAVNPKKESLKEHVKFVIGDFFEMDKIIHR